MADNTVLDSGSGGDTIGTDDIGGVKYQRVKIIVGADGTNDGDVASGNPLPVSNAGLTELAAAIDTEVQVDVVGALPSGTNAIGKLAANSGVDIGDVDVLSIAAGDNNIGNVDIVTMPNVTLAAGTNNVGDVDVLTMPATLVDDATFVPTSSTVVMTGATFDDTSPDSVNEGDGGAVRMSSRRELYVQLRDAAGNERGVNVNASGNIGVILQANSGVDVGDVSVNDVTPGTGSSNLGKQVDNSAGGTDVGVVTLAVRDDTLSTLTPADGDYTPLRVSSTGALHVTGAGGGTQYNTSDVATVVATGTLSVVKRTDTLAALGQADGDWAHMHVNANGALWVQPVAGSAEFADDSTFVAGSSTIVMTGAVFDDTSPDSVNEGDAGALRMSGRRELYVQIRDAAGNERGLNIDSSGRIAVTGAAAGTEYNTNSVATTLAAGTLSLVERDDTLSSLSQADGDWAHMRVDSQGALWVRDTSSGTTQAVSLLSVPQHTVLGTGTFSVQVTSISAGDNNIGNVDLASAIPAGANNIGDVDVLTIAAGDNNIGNVDIVSLPASTNTLEVVGDVAHGVTATGNPVLSSGISQNVIATPAPTNRVSSAGMSTIMAVDRDGALFVRTHPPQTFSYHLDTSSAQTDATVSNAAGAGLCHYIGTVTFSSGAATAINLLISDGNTTTAIGPYYLEAVAGRGMAVTFNPPRKLSANTSVCITTSASIAHSVDITGFIAP